MMLMKNLHSSVRSTFVKIAKLHVVVGVVFAAQLIAYDAGKLITPEAVLKRWVIIGILILASACCWYLARLNNTAKVIRNLAWLLIATDLAVASFSVYTQRGMASRAVLLFILPLFVAASLQRKGLIFLTALIATLCYITSGIAYFVLNFNEGYKLELYGELGFYSALILISAAMIWSLVRRKN